MQDNGILLFIQVMSDDVCDNVNSSANVGDIINFSLRCFANPLKHLMFNQCDFRVVKNKLADFRSLQFKCDFIMTNNNK